MSGQRVSAEESTTYGVSLAVCCFQTLTAGFAVQRHHYNGSSSVCSDTLYVPDFVLSCGIVWVGVSCCNWGASVAKMSHARYHTWLLCVGQTTRENLRGYSEQQDASLTTFCKGLRSFCCGGGMIGFNCAADLHYG